MSRYLSMLLTKCYPIVHISVLLSCQLLALPQCSLSRQSIAPTNELLSYVRSTIERTIILYRGRWSLIQVWAVQLHKSFKSDLALGACHSAPPLQGPRVKIADNNLCVQCQAVLHLILCYCCIRGSVVAVDTDAVDLCSYKTSSWECFFGWLVSRVYPSLMNHYCNFNKALRWRPRTHSALECFVRASFELPHSGWRLFDY